MPQLEHIEAIEKRLWTSADNLRANSNYASNEYFLRDHFLKLVEEYLDTSVAEANRVAEGVPEGWEKVILSDIIQINSNIQ